MSHVFLVPRHQAIDNAVENNFPPSQSTTRLCTRYFAAWRQKRGDHQPSRLCCRNDCKMGSQSQRGHERSFSFHDTPGAASSTSSNGSRVVKPYGNLLEETAKIRNDLPTSFVKEVLTPRTCPSSASLRILGVCMLDKKRCVHPKII